jgi:hypothetical protein
MMDVAITWHEFWYQGLEDAANSYFTDKDEASMLEKLRECHGHWHAQLCNMGYPVTAAAAAINPENSSTNGNSNSGADAAAGGSSSSSSSTSNSRRQGSEHEKLPGNCPATVRVVAFVHAFGRELAEAAEWVAAYQSSQCSDRAAINHAWELYSGVFRRLKKQINNVDMLEMQHVSPALLAARNLTLAVPGTYTHRSAPVRIAHFSTTVKVITSKQRPRHMTIFGSDGRAYPFLLKGHEDLRQVTV